MLYKIIKMKTLFIAIILLFHPSFSYASANMQECTGNTAVRLTCEFGEFINLSVYIGYAIGVLLFVLGGIYLYLMNKNPGQYGIGSVIGALTAATLFTGFANLITLYQSAIFGGYSEIYSLNQYNEMVQRIKGPGSSQFGYASSQTMQALVGFVKFVGVLAMLRSIYMIYMLGKNGGRDGTSGWGVIVFGLGGAIAFRIEEASCLLADFFGIQSICIL